MRKSSSSVRSGVTLRIVLLIQRYVFFFFFSKTRSCYVSCWITHDYVIIGTYWGPSCACESDSEQVCYCSFSLVQGNDHLLILVVFSLLFSFLSFTSLLNVSLSRSLLLLLSLSFFSYSCSLGNCKHCSWCWIAVDHRLDDNRSSAADVSV